MPRYRKTGGSLYEAANRFREYNGAFRRVLRSYRKVGSSLYQFFESGNVMTVTLPSSGVGVFGGVQAQVQLKQGQTTPHPSLGTALALDNTNAIFLRRLLLHRSGSVFPGQIQLNLADAPDAGFATGDDFSDAMEANGTITIVASDGETLVVTGISDSTEPYLWVPSNGAEVAAFADHIAGLTDRSVTVTFNDNP